jgi:serine protease Do
VTLSIAAVVVGACTARGSVGGSLAPVVAQVQPKMVKIYGAGGVHGLEAYQSGFLFRPDGYVLTAWSYVLDAGEATVILNDGRKFNAALVGIDPHTDVAVLKVDAVDLPCFSFEQAVELNAGTRVLAFSNLYGIATGDEPSSVLQGIVSGVTSLSARRGAFRIAYNGPVYLLDAMTNNAGAAGGALTDSQGRLAAILGKELRDAQVNTWINYAIPIAQLTNSIDDILAGKSQPRNQAADAQRAPLDPVTLESLGLVMVPNVLAKTPPFVDQVRRASPAAKAGILADDLIVLVGEQMVQSQNVLVSELSLIDRIDAVELTVLRDGQLLEVTLEPDTAR